MKSNYLKRSLNDDLDMYEKQIKVGCHISSRKEAKG
jgi:hypothetical protein